MQFREYMLFIEGKEIKLGKKARKHSSKGAFKTYMHMKMHTSEIQYYIFNQC